ncbi:MAG TPA: methyltransferase [Candidatus Binatia bacterium]
MRVDAPNRLAVDTPQRPARARRPSWLHRLVWSAAWDVTMRALGILWTGYLLAFSVTGLMAFATAHPESMSGAVVVSALAARLAFAVFLLLLLLLFVVRLEPVARAAGVAPRLAALGGTFLPTLFGFLPRHDGSTVLNLASFVCIAAGNALAVYALLHLSRSASMMAEARRLVTSGPYRFVQHPVYLFEALAVAGVLLGYLWPPRVAAVALAIFAGHVWCQLRRMRHEETVLDAAFPEYGGYRRRTARLIPGVY